MLALDFKPIDQTILGDSPWGNCLQACVASLLGVEIEEVPNFITFMGLNGNGWWFSALSLFLHARDLRMRLTVNDGRNDPPIGYAIACGVAIRSGGRQGGHAVVVKNGQVVHDPHPSRWGLVAVNYWIQWGSGANENDFLAELRDHLPYYKPSVVNKGALQYHEQALQWAESRLRSMLSELPQVEDFKIIDEKLWISVLIKLKNEKDREAVNALHGFGPVTTALECFPGQFHFPDWEEKKIDQREDPA